MVACGRRLEASTSLRLPEAITMRTSVGRGRIYRRCGCRDTQHHQLGAHCPQRPVGGGLLAVRAPAATVELNLD